MKSYKEPKHTDSVLPALQLNYDAWKLQLSSKIRQQIKSTNTRSICPLIKYKVQ